MAVERIWPMRPLKDCAVWYSGGTPNKGTSSYWGGSIPWISAKSLTSFFVADSEERVTEEGARNGTRLVPADTILFIVRGMSLKTEFRIGITTRPVTFNQDLKALVAVDDVLPAYLAYAIRARANDILQLVGEAGHGTGVLPTDRIQALEIPIPSVEEQQAVTRVVGALDDKIVLNRKMNETLEAMARALFKSWFIDFDPVRAKAEGRAPSGMDAETAKLFPSEFVGSELGDVPKGWSVTSVGELLSLEYGKALKESARQPGHVLVFGSNGVVGRHSEPLVRGAGIVVGRKGNPGIVSWAPSDFFVIDTAFYVVPRASTISLRFLRYLLESLHLSRLSADSAVPGVNRDAIYAQLVVQPPVEVLARFHELAEMWGCAVAQFDREAATLARLRDELLPRLLSGELDVSSLLSALAP